MTTQKTFKRRVRARMAKTGESYTAARRVLIAKGERPETTAEPFEPPVSDAAMTNATGHDWQHWFDVLDAWGGASRPHTEIARWLVDEHGVPGWWAQSVTVVYERARGLRSLGEHANGWSVTASKTVAAPVERLFDAFDDASLRERWLPGADLRLRTATSPRTARYDWEDGATRVNVGFARLADDKSRVALEHERLPDAQAADEMKRYWRDRLVALKRLVEEGGA